MHISRMDLNLFVVLETIYSEGNITRASQKLNLTQPAVSHALGRLRDVLKDPLFVRQGANRLQRHLHAISSRPFAKPCKHWN